MGKWDTTKTLILAVTGACVLQLPFLILLRVYGMHSTAGGVGYLFYVPADFLLEWLFPAGFFLGEVVGWFVVQAMLITPMAFLFLRALCRFVGRSAGDH